MTSDPAIVVDAVTKRYRRDPTTRRTGDTGTHVAVDAVDLTVERGETVGILGHNGAGKTTLLRLIAGVTAPTEGRITTRGRVVPLISVGVGFHSELSGHENVIVNGMLLGLAENDLRADMGSIVDFAELEGHMAEPVKLYSTGMMLRLAFSVAMHARPDVLLLDEILAVGDTAFQLKCLDRMTELQRRGTTIVFVSHSVHAVRLLCPRALVMYGGAVRYDGPSDGAVGAYHRLLSGRADRATAAGAAVRLLDGHVVDAEGRAPHEMALGERYHLRCRLVADRAVTAPSVELVTTSEAGVEAYRTVAPLDHGDLAPGDDLDLDVAFSAAMAGGSYRLALRVLDAHGVDVGGDGGGVSVYRPPALGSYGTCELDASITLAGTVINDHGRVEIGADR